MNTQPDYKLAAEELQAFAITHKLTADWYFVPFSKSRNKDEKTPSLNWLYTLNRDGRVVLAGDYMQGAAHCPAYKAPVSRMGAAQSVLRTESIARECETGKSARENSLLQGPALPTPTIADLLSSLALDASAIDFATYEDWAGDYGYDVDSRKGEALYRACLETGLKLRAALGDAALTEMRELAGRM